MRDPALDMFDPPTAHRSARSSSQRYRAGAASQRNRRISGWAEEQLAILAAPGHFPTGLEDLAFVVHGTCGDLRMLDGAIDPSDREVGVSLWGPPAVANYLPAGISRVSTLRSWLNQWSVDHTRGDALDWLPEIDVPVLVVSGTADPTVLPHIGPGDVRSRDRGPRRSEVAEIAGATHYFEGQPELLAQALDGIAAWIHEQV